MAAPAIAVVARLAAHAQTSPPGLLNLRGLDAKSKGAMSILAISDPAVLAEIHDQAFDDP